MECSVYLQKEWLKIKKKKNGCARIPLKQWHEGQKLAHGTQESSSSCLQYMKQALEAGTALQHEYSPQQTLSWFPFDLMNEPQNNKI